MSYKILQEILYYQLKKKINLNYNQPSSISRICENKHKKIIK